jgi:aminodeoxyfutalosine synthase
MNTLSDIQNAIALYDENDMNVLAGAATIVRERLNGNKVYYNRNFHLEPSNVCIHRCKFCSYRRGSIFEEGAWSMELPGIREYCLSKLTPDITEIHIVGSVDPSRNLDYYYNLIETVRKSLPDTVAIKAFSAVEIDDMAVTSGKSIEEILRTFKALGVSALPGGGAEIFDEEIRRIICPDKCSSERWLDIHRTAHKLGLRTNCTMLFGHIESRAQRINHMQRLKELQDETGGFDAFIPLLFKPANNQMYFIREAEITEILKTFAIARIFLDNIPHLKAYWPMLGKEHSQLALLYGADDIDGTINDSTKIYSMAGADEKPVLTVQEIEKMASDCGYIATERDSLYNEIKK